MRTGGVPQMNGLVWWVTTSDVLRPRLVGSPTKGFKNWINFIFLNRKSFED